MWGEFATFRTTFLLDTMYAAVIMEMQTTAENMGHRAPGSSAPRPCKQKTAWKAAVRHACTLVEAVRTAVKENSDFLVPVQRLLYRVNREKGKATVLLPVV